VKYLKTALAKVLRDPGDFHPVLPRFRARGVPVRPSGDAKATRGLSGSLIRVTSARLRKSTTANTVKSSTVGQRCGLSNHLGSFRRPWGARGCRIDFPYCLLGVEIDNRGGFVFYRTADRSLPSRVTNTLWTPAIHGMLFTRLRDVVSITSMRLAPPGCLPAPRPPSPVMARLFGRALRGTCGGFLRSFDPRRRARLSDSLLT